MCENNSRGDKETILSVTTRDKCYSNTELLTENKHISVMDNDITEGSTKNEESTQNAESIDHNGIYLLDNINYSVYVYLITLNSIYFI